MLADQNSDVLFVELREKDLRCIGGISPIFLSVFYFFRPADKIFLINVQGTAERCCVESVALFVHYHCYLINRLIEHQQFAIAVVDKPAGRVDGLFEQSIVVRLVSGGGIHYLQLNQTY